MTIKQSKIKLNQFLNAGVVLTLFISTIILLTACQDNEQYDEPEITTLTVHARDVYSQVLLRAATSMSREWLEEWRGFRLERITYCPLDRDTQLTSLQVQLMAGDAPDIIFWDGIPLWPHQASGLFADINVLMEQNPNTNREDFYCHVLDAWEFDGGLYNFPLSFEFDSVGISPHLPQSIINRFQEHSSITNHELLRIYLDLIDQYPEFSHMAIGYGKIDRILFEFGFELSNFIDFDSRYSNINTPEFISFLNDLKLVFELSPEIPTPVNLLYDINMWDTHSNNSVFFDFFRTTNFILDTPEFISFIPFAARDGGLRLVQHYNYFPVWIMGPEYIDFFLHQNGEALVYYITRMQL